MLSSCVDTLLCHSVGAFMSASHTPRVGRIASCVATANRAVLARAVPATWEQPACVVTPAELTVIVGQNLEGIHAPWFNGGIPVEEAPGPAATGGPEALPLQDLRLIARAMAEPADPPPVPSPEVESEAEDDGGEDAPPEPKKQRRAKAALADAQKALLALTEERAKQRMVLAELRRGIRWWAPGLRMV